MSYEVDSRVTLTTDDDNLKPVMVTIPALASLVVSIQLPDETKEPFEAFASTVAAVGFAGVND